MALVRPTDQSNVVPATVAAIDQLDKLTGMLNILLHGGISEINCGNALIHWPGGSQFSTGLDIAHGLTVPGHQRPKVFLVTVNGNGGTIPFAAVSANAPGAIDTVRVQAATIDGSSPLVSDTTAIDWLAIN